MTLSKGEAFSHRSVKPSTTTDSYSIVAFFRVAWYNMENIYQEVRV